MALLHPQFLLKDGWREFVVLPYEELVALQEEIEELEDIRQLSEAIAAEKDTPLIPWAEAKKQLELE
jgi:hypothetical protein